MPFENAIEVLEQGKGSQAEADEGRPLKDSNGKTGKGEEAEHFELLLRHNKNQLNGEVKGIYGALTLPPLQGGWDGWMLCLLMVFGVPYDKLNI
jgi:hypothetical protein